MLLCSQNKKNQLIIIMKVLKHLGLVVMLITAVVLVLSYFNGWSNNNTITIEAGTNYTLPLCGFTAPEGRQFKTWRVE